ncbi:hypothetical protein KEM52_004433, partial [Ascosphaera acerosa]
MPPRQSRQLAVVSTRPKPKSTAKSGTRAAARGRKRALNAFTIAEEQFPSRSGVARHRLGDAQEDSDDDDHARHAKRRRRTAEQGEGEGREHVLAEDDEDRTHFTDSDGNE